jgi:hypothetical protein
MSIPRKPISIPAGRSRAFPVSNAAAADTTAAPARAPALPAAVIPPLVPGGTGSRDHKSLGADRLCPPTVDAQVSAAAAESVAVTSQTLRAGSEEPSTASSAAAAPLASTCQASRRSPLASILSVRGVGATLEIRLLEMKKAASTAPPIQPVPWRIAAPTTEAARAPDEVRVAENQAMQVTLALTRTASRSDGWLSGSPSPSEAD